MSRVRGAVVPLAFLALLAFASGCQQPPSDATLDFRASVSVVPAARGPVEHVLETTGTVRAAEEAKVVVETAGKLTVARNPATGRRWAVGDSIQKGQVIGFVDPEDVRTSARIESRRQALAAAQTELERNQQLHAEGLISSQVLAEKEVALANARADFDNARLQEAKGRLASPIAGVLTSVTTAADGEFASSSGTVAEVKDFSEVIVDLDLGTGEVLDVRPGQVVRVGSYAAEDTFEGTVLRIAPAIDPQSRTFRVEVLVANPDLRLRPGMFVRASIVIERRDDVVTVPPDAVVERDGRLTVFVVEYAKTPGQEVAQESAQAREVSIGLVSDAAVEITNGLKPGDRVVVSGQDTLKDGTRVIVRG